jgi:hypothetical protein
MMESMLQKLLKLNFPRSLTAIEFHYFYGDFGTYKRGTKIKNSGGSEAMCSNMANITVVGEVTQFAPI